MRRREVLAAGAASASAVLAGCTGSGSSAPPVFEITEMGTQPQELDVDPGTTVTWRNELEGPGKLQRETIRSERLYEEAEEWEFEVTLEENGDEATYTFEEEGMYTFVGENRGEDCVCGAVLVGDAPSIDDPLPCAPIRGGC